MSKWHVNQFVRGRWVVRDERNIPLHVGDGSRAQDKPAIFTDYDSASECAERLTAEDFEQ